MTPDKAAYRAELVAVLDDLLLGLPGVRRGQMFGVPAYFAGRKMFACIYGDGIGMKLPAATVSKQLQQPGFSPFQPYGKPKMREWLALHRALADDYRQDFDLLQAAYDFVAAGD